MELKLIKPDKSQPRKTFDEEKLRFLAESILSNGLLKPIEVDEDGIVIDGERRYRASKIAGLKDVEVRVVKLAGNTSKRLRHQLVVDIQDEDIPTGERYEALVKLWKLENSGPEFSRKKFCKEMGIGDGILQSAMDYTQFALEEPEIVKTVAPRIITETASLPKEERKEILEEFRGTKDRKTGLIREMVKGKKEEIKTKKQLEELKKKNIELRESKKWEVKVTTTKDVLDSIKKGIISTHNELSGLMGRVRRIRKTKFYLYKAKDKENFIRFLDGASDRARKWASELDDLKENIEMEIVKE